MNDFYKAFAHNLDGEVVNQDIDKVDLFAERMVEDESETDIEFE